jgi:hypothetical protein
MQLCVNQTKNKKREGKMKKKKKASRQSWRKKIYISTRYIFHSRVDNIQKWWVREKNTEKLRPVKKLGAHHHVIFVLFFRWRQVVQARVALIIRGGVRVSAPFLPPRLHPSDWDRRRRRPKRASERER